MIDYHAMAMDMLAELHQDFHTTRNVKDHAPDRVQWVIDRLKQEGYYAWVSGDVLCSSLRFFYRQ
jgi:hypothetical protein